MMAPRRSPAFAPTLGLGLGLACASIPTTAPRYSPRPSNCDLAVFHTPVPGVPLWDDLGIAEAACHISGPETECLRALKAEACRMGGDIIYNLPRKPFRPQDQTMLYRGQVAHSRAGTQKKADDQDLPPPATPEESAGPVVPLTGPGPDAR